ncbi:MAG TPA: hypothetical protein VG125_29345 [Pirellulales bacterium]|nr:hypothetical protein [Pirellulales bacterium]
MKKTAETQPVADTPRVKVGDLVTVGVAEGNFKGIVVEDRGPIGADGRRLYGIVEIDVEPTALELPEERFSDLAAFGSPQYLHELCEAIVDAAARSKAEIIVSYYVPGDVQVRGRSMLPHIPRRDWIVEQIDGMLARDTSGRVELIARDPPDHRSQQKWYAVRAV